MIKDFQYQVLREVMRLRGSGYAFPIAEAISEDKNKRIALGAIHETLRRLEKEGYVKSRVDVPADQKNARPRRYYKITGLGERALRAREQEVARIYGGVLAGAGSL